MLISILILAIGIIIAALLFLCFGLAFKQGLRLGMLASKGTSPAPIKTPIAVVEEWWKAKGDEKKSKEIQSGIDAMFNYNGDLPKEVDED